MAIVPGHGDIVDRDFVVSQHEELVAVAELAARFVEGEVEMEEAMGRGPYPRSVMSTALLRARATAG